VLSSQGEVSQTNAVFLHYTVIQQVVFKVRCVCVCVCVVFLCECHLKKAANQTGYYHAQKLLSGIKTSNGFKNLKRDKAQTQSAHADSTHQGVH